MGFALLVLYLVLTFVRPGDQLSSLAAWRVMEIASLSALGAAVLALLAGRGPSFRAPQIPLVVVFLVWSLVSVVASPNRSAAALDGVLDFAKSSVTAFFLLVLNIDTIRRLRIVAATLSVLGVLVVGQGVLAYHFGVDSRQFIVYSPGSSGPTSGWDDPLVELAEERAGPEAGMAGGGVARIRGLGFLHDPNDLACTLVAILPLLMALRRETATLRNALLLWVPAGVIVYGIYLTRSRGGILAFTGVVALAVRQRFGRTLSVLAAGGALVILLALGFSSGRSMAIDESASGRIEAWSAGLQMLKSSPVWGVGFGMFTQYNERVAHNSFVHCFAELGLVGYFIWLALIVLTLDDVRSVSRSDEEEATDLRRLGSALSISLVGFLIGAVFLSHSYDVMLFILLGLGAAVAELARQHGGARGPRNPLLWSNALVALELVSITVIWGYMRLMR
jgi:O-antigen ligase/polysaccharide polymerase Wzy-like membrane protein